MGMGFKAPAAEVVGVLKRVGKALPANHSVEILHGVRITTGQNVANFLVTNMSFHLQEQIELKGARPGECVVLGAADLLKGLDTLEGDVRFTQERDTLAVKNGTTILRYPLGELSDYPKLSSDEKPRTDGTIVSRQELLLTYETIHDAISKDQSRPVLTGVHFRLDQDELALRMTATDSYRLGSDSCMVQESAAFHPIVVNGADLAKALRTMTGEKVLVREVVEAAEQATWLILESEGRTAILRAIDGQFPDWERLIPETWEGSFVLKRKEAIKVFRRMAKLNSTGVVRLKQSTDGESVIALQEKGQSSIESKLEAHFTAGEPQPFGVNPGFFADALEAVGADEVRVHFVNPLRPFLVTEPEYGEGFSYSTRTPDRFHLVMPIRLAS